MSVYRQTSLCLAAALSGAFAGGCAGASSGPPAAPSTPATSAKAAFSLDERKLPAPVRLSASDLDDGKSPLR